MRTIFLVSIAALGLTVFAGSADARTYPYCLVGTSGATSGGHLTCAYSTLAQCRAAKPSQTDYCVRNPRLSYGKARR